MSLDNGIRGCEKSPPTHQRPAGDGSRACAYVTRLEASQSGPEQSGKKRENSKNTRQHVAICPPRRRLPGAWSMSFSAAPPFPRATSVCLRRHVGSILLCMRQINVSRAKAVTCSISCNCRPHSLHLAWRRVGCATYRSFCCLLIIVLVRQERFEEAITLLGNVLADMPQWRGTPKYETACRYNLGVAYLRLGQEANAVQHFQQVIELLPSSLYARAAEAAIRRRGRSK